MATKVWACSRAVMSSNEIKASVKSHPTRFSCVFWFPCLCNCLLCCTFLKLCLSFAIKTEAQAWLSHPPAHCGGRFANRQDAYEACIPCVLWLVLPLSHLGFAQLASHDLNILKSNLKKNIACEMRHVARPNFKKSDCHLIL